MKLLLLGGSSFVGAAIRADTKWPCNSVFTAHTTHPSGAINLDLLDRSEVQRVIREVAPTHVLDVALPARDDPETAEKCARNFVRFLRNHAPNARYVLVSTDAVFDGSAGRPYTEGDTPCPTSPYGCARAAVERTILAGIADSCVARTCLVYGRDLRKEGFVLDSRLDWILAHARTGIHQYAEQYRTPTFVSDLAGGLLRLAGSRERGVIHIAGPTRCSRAHFARLAVLAFGLESNLVRDQPLPAVQAFGTDTSLSSARAVAALGWAPLSPVLALAQLRRVERSIRSGTF
jgi:dTDP-4-dehydrorhamnose reductase